LTRVKKYFQKIQAAEEGPVKPRENLNLDKEAAGRFIKHALVRASRCLTAAIARLTQYQAGNGKADLNRAEREAKEKLIAKRKLKAMSDDKQSLQPVVSKTDSTSASAPRLSNDDEVGQVGDTTVTSSSTTGIVIPEPAIDQPPTSGKAVPKPPKKDGKQVKKRGGKGSKRKHESQDFKDERKSKRQKKKKKKTRNSQSGE
jgi:hypothetical protein